MPANVWNENVPRKGLYSSDSPWDLGLYHFVV